MLDACDTPAAPRAPYEIAARGATILAVAGALPANVVPTLAVADRLGVSEEWIVSRTGIRERRRADPEQRLDELAAQAAERALEDASVHPASIDLVLVATTTSDELMPPAAPLVAARLGAVHAGAIDIGAACTGFVAALLVGGAQIESGRADRVLVVGADILSRYTDADDPHTAAIFGDGAGAVVLGAAGAGGSAIGPVTLGADGATAGHIRARRGGAIEMRGQDTYRDAVDHLCGATVMAARCAGVRLGEIDLFVYHQANGRILQAVGRRLELPEGRVVDCIGRLGNTAAASVPLALAAAEADGRLVPGARVLLAACGAGFTWGGVVVEWKRA